VPRRLISTPSLGITSLLFHLLGLKGFLISTPSLGITAYGLVDCEPAKNFNSLSRDHQDYSVGHSQTTSREFQLPLSGSLEISKTLGLKDQD
jgi:hypothetical protein